MAVQQVTGSTTTADTSSTSASSAVSQEQFLQILITQLKYQNPLDPLKPDEFLSQLSQLTEVEQLTNIAKNTETMAQNGSGNIADWLSAVGKKVGVESNALTKGDEIVLSPQSDYDKILLTFKDLSTGNTKEVTLKKGDSLTYTYQEEGNVGLGITALKNGKIVSCGAELYRLVQAIQTGESGVHVVLGDGTTQPVSAITKIRQ